MARNVLDADEALRQIHIDVSQDTQGIFRDQSRDNALNFHKIRDFCILAMVMNLTLK